jgi:hypothetical protein
VGGTIKCEVKGTVSWTVEDDQGRAHDLVIPDTPMCEALPRRLFSLQHWAQGAEKVSRTLYHRGERPTCTTNAVATILTRGRGKFVKTIQLDKRKNVAVMTTRPGIKKYNAFAAKVTSLEQTICCFVATGAPQPSKGTVNDDNELIGSSSGTDPESDSEESADGAHTMSHASQERSMERRRTRHQARHRV